MTTLTGRIVEVSTVPLGDVLIADATVGDAVLFLNSVVDFNEEGGTLSFLDPADDETVITATYTGLDVDAETITLTSALVVDLPLDAFVSVLPTSDEKVAQVMVDGEDESISVRVPHQLFDLIAEGVRDPGEEEAVEVGDDDGGDWQVLDVLGKVPLLDGSHLDPETIPTSDGVPPATSPDVSLIGTVGALLASWSAVTNADPVTYDLHVGSSPGVPTDGSQLFGSTDSTFATLVLTPGTWYVVAVARDADGEAAPGVEASATVIAPVTTVDLTALQDQLDDLDAALTTTAADVTAAQGDITTLQADLTSATGDISTLQTDLTTAQADIVTAQGQVDYLGTVYLPALAGQLTTAQADIISAQGDISTLTMTTIPGLNTSIAANTAALVTAAGNVTALQALFPITTTSIANDAITTPKILAGNVVAGSIAAGSITTAKIAAGAVTATEIGALAVTTAKLDAGAVTAAKITAGTITATEIATGTITAGLIAAGAITTVKLAAGAVTATELAAGSVNASKIVAGTITATELGAGSVTTAKIVAGAITTTELAAGAVTATKIVAGTITATELSAGSITTVKLAAGAVTTTELAAGAVTAVKITAGTITATQIATGTLTANEIAAGAITTVKLAAGAVTATEIAAGAITATKLSATAINGMTITGAVIQTNSTGNRMVMRDDGSGGVLEGWLGQAGETASLVNPTNLGGVEKVVQIRSGTSTARPYESILRLQASTVQGSTGGGSILGYAGNVTLQGSTSGGGTSQLSLTGTTAQIANVGGTLILNSSGMDWNGGNLVHNDTTVAVSSPFTSGSVILQRFGSLVVCTASVLRSSSFATAFTAVCTIPVGYRPASSIIFPGSAVFNSTVTYQFQCTSAGSFELRQSAAEPNSRTLTACWFTN